MNSIRHGNVQCYRDISHLDQMQMFPKQEDSKIWIHQAKGSSQVIRVLR